ncbi:hypothetical protein H5410_062357 [Solanum commersonii]|uniref:Phospholipase/carboxylesterase/thioesterase domain-containing protein n=1 Tax=Solanum commersonii TaxID=4109 RepID=A0A9J5WBA6_SOLCO|nr:hypothetical protein H5410_062357 [Solanum commersonii]
MSYINPSMGSGSRTARRTMEFGRTYVVRPKGKHQATMVWLHGLGDNGSSSSQLLESLALPNMVLVVDDDCCLYDLADQMDMPNCPNSSVAILGGFPCAACKNEPDNYDIVTFITSIYMDLHLIPGFDAGELSDDTTNDLDGLEASVAHIANLLSTEPADVKLGIGGFSMGAATALYSATCFAHGKYGNGNPYPVNLRGCHRPQWLASRFQVNMRNKIEGSHEAARCAASLPILLCHGKCDEVVPYRYGERASCVLSSAGFRNLQFKAYDGLGHYTVPREMDEVCNWLNARLCLEGSRR